MPQSLSRVLIHTIFSTKDRAPFLSDAETRAAMHSFLGGSLKTLDCYPIRVGGGTDHVHLLSTLARSMSISNFVKEIKRTSTAWIQKRGGIYSKFRWQAGYATFSVSESLAKEVARYIDDQETHHRKITFQEELREFLRLHEVEFDERFLWD